MILVTAVRLHGGDGHEHLTHVRWRTADGRSAADTSVATMVQYVSEGGDAAVRDGDREVRVLVERRTGEASLLRAHDGVGWTDDLLALPRF